jgi:hypothetical protein
MLGADPIDRLIVNRSTTAKPIAAPLALPRAKRGNARPPGAAVLVDPDDPRLDAFVEALACAVLEDLTSNPTR